MAAILAILSGIMNIGCILFVAFKMLEEEGALKALFGLICCQIYAYIWGWLHLEEQIRWRVMGVWTVSLIVGGVANYYLSQELGTNY